MDSGRIVREIPVDIPYPRQSAAADVLLLQQEILAALGGL
jgi:hypothetical protein